MLALLAIGFSLIFGVARIVNIAHTAFYMVGGLRIYYYPIKIGLHPGLGDADCWGPIGITLLGLLA